ncbi:MAG: thioredoxin family protein [Bdellovibrionales bacterium]|nr:thioredoxin family protein [Bdellovibrionales bacterium]
MRFSILVSLFLAAAGSAFADAQIGKAAPDFKLTDTNGKTHELKDLKGKTVVLEWLNFDCPFVKKHYGSGNMQKLQAAETAKGVVWFSIVSSAKGKQGYFEPKAMNERQAKEKGMQTAILYDTDGKVGKAYGAKSTPHMFVIDKDGKVAYSGAIDDKDSTDLEDVAKAKNYVRAALDDLRANRKVATAETKPYGCGVKYQ